MNNKIDVKPLVLNKPVKSVMIMNTTNSGVVVNDNIFLVNSDYTLQAQSKID